MQQKAPVILNGWPGLFCYLSDLTHSDRRTALARAAQSAEPGVLPCAVDQFNVRGLHEAYAPNSTVFVQAPAPHVVINGITAPRTLAVFYYLGAGIK